MPSTPQWQRYLAITVAIALAFAAGLFVQSVFGSAYIPPFSQATICAEGSDPAACQSAQSTAVIAWWTRLDTIFSLFTALAAFFAFMAYVQAKRQADIGAAAFRHSVERSNKELDLLASEKRAILSFSKCELELLVFAEDIGPTLQFSLDIILKNDGQTSARQPKVFGQIRPLGRLRSEAIELRPPVEFREIEHGDTDYAYCEFATRLRLKSHAIPNFRLRFDLIAEWQDFAGFKVTRRFFAHPTIKGNDLDFWAGDIEMRPLRLDVQMTP